MMPLRTLTDVTPIHCSSASIPGAINPGKRTSVAPSIRSTHAIDVVERSGELLDIARATVSYGSPLERPPAPRAAGPTDATAVCAAAADLTESRLVHTVRTRTGEGRP